MDKKFDNFLYPLIIEKEIWKEIPIYTNVTNLVSNLLGMIIPAAEPKNETIGLW